MDPTPPFRAARPEDAGALAELMDRAGEGIPRLLWARAAGPGQDPLEVGAARATRTTGWFSHTNAVVLEQGGAVVAMLLSYRLDDPYDSGHLSQAPDVVRPLIELEAEAPGTWYINAIAVDPAYEGCGRGRVLMSLAEQLGRESGAKETSLIVADQNVRARKLYERLGYEVRGRRPVVPFPGFAHGGDWVLMVKRL